MKTGKLKVKQPSQLQEILNVARSLIDETIQLSVETLPTFETKTKLLQLKSVLEMQATSFFCYICPLTLEQRVTPPNCTH